MSFDPDAYLAKKAATTKGEDFDPDAYLSAKRTPEMIAATSAIPGWQGPPQATEMELKVPQLPAGVDASRVRGYEPKTGVWSLAPEDGKPLVSTFTDTGKQFTSSELKSAEKRPVYDPYAPLKAGASGALEGSTFGFADEIGALIEGGDYKKARDMLREAHKREQAKDPGMAVAGSLLGGTLLPVGGIGSGTIRTLATGAAAGGLSALGGSEKELTGPNRDLSGAALDVVKGAGIGTAGAGLIAGGKAVKDFISTAPTRIATRADNDLFSAATRGMTPTQRERLGRLAEGKGDLLKLIREDPAFESAVLNLGKTNTEDAARAAAAIADARAGEAALTASKTRNILAKEAGPLGWEDVAVPLETEAQRKAASLVPSVNKAGEEIAGIAAKVKERNMPVSGKALLSRVAKDVDPATRARIDLDPESYAKVLDRAKAGKAIDNPAKVVEQLNKLEENILSKTAPIRQKAGSMTLQELSATITKAAQDAAARNPEEFIATGVDATKNAQPMIARLWKTYAPEHVDEAGNVIASPAALKARISIDDARRLVTKMQSNVFNENPLGETAADRMRKTVAMAAKEKVDEMVARNLSPKKAEEFADLNRQESRIISLRNGLEKKAIDARLAENPPQEFTRTGKIDPRDLMTTAKEVKSEEAQTLLNKIIESHMGKSRMGAIKSAEERAKLAGELADAIAGQVRKNAGDTPPGLRQIADEKSQDIVSGLRGGALTAVMTGHPLVAAGILSGTLGMKTSRDQIARKIDRGIAAMTNVAQRTASPKLIAKAGEVAGLGAGIVGEVVNILSTRTFPAKIGKRE